jgi:nicotinamide-nucleotide amidase
MDVELITIGDELLLGFTIDTNAAHLARELASIGIGIQRRATVGDVAEDIAAAVHDAIERTGAVITTGGLGPTSDDLTKPSIAALFGRGMKLDQEHVDWMEQRWLQRFQRKMPESNRAQAMLPEGATKLANRHGSAPGIWLEDEKGRWVAMLPGVPREMKGMLADTLLPRLSHRASAAGAPTVVRSRTVRTTGVAESLLADQIDPIREQLGPIALAYLPGADGVDLRLTIRGVSSNGADETLGRAAALVRAKLGRSIYAEGDADLT